MAKKPTDTPAAPAASLTDQQRRFVEEYCTDFNATRAAIAAKYSKNSARQQGSRLLTIANIQAEIKSRLEELSMPAAEVTKRLSDIARADITGLFKTRTVVTNPDVPVPLATIIAELEEEIDFEEEYSARVNYDKDEREDHRRRQRGRRRKLVRLQMELERNPAATRMRPGPPVEHQEQVLDLQYARETGAMRLVKSVKPTRHGNAVELYPADAALTNLARVRGLFNDKLEVTGEVKTVTFKIKKGKEGGRG